MNFHVRYPPASYWQWTTFRAYSLFDMAQYSGTRQVYQAVCTGPSQTNMGPNILTFNTGSDYVELVDTTIQVVDWQTKGFNDTTLATLATEIATVIKAGVANNTTWRTTSYLSDWYSTINDFNLILFNGYPQDMGSGTYNSYIPIFYPGSDIYADAVIVI